LAVSAIVSRTLEPLNLEYIKNIEIKLYYGWGIV